MDMKLKPIPIISVILSYSYISFARSTVCPEEPELHQVSLLQHAISMSSSIAVDLGTSVATATQVANSAWQHTTVMSSSVEAVRVFPPPPPLLYLKTHKTGSSTLANVIHRWGERRNMSFMLPWDPFPKNLGYPYPFPGNQTALYYGPPKHQFDVICNHAVLNTSYMFGYLKPNAYFLTSVREPTEQMISWKNYNEGDSRFTWNEYLNMLENQLFDQDRPEFLKHYNMQAFDLGWYDFVGGSTEFDHDQTKISEWLATLDKYLNGTVLSEYFDEGLVLLRQKLQMDIEELVYVTYKENSDKVLPTEDERQRLARLGNVDRALYAHLNQSFWQEWFSGNVSQLEADVVTLRQLKEDMQRYCDEGESERCPPSFTMDNDVYTIQLRKEQSVV